MNSKSAIVFGSSGLVGSYLLDLLIRQGYSQIQVWTRRPINFDSKQVEQVLWNPEFNNETQLIRLLEDKMLSGDVFIALGTTIKTAGSKEKFEWVDFHLPRIVYDVAERKSCEKIAIVSSIGANPKSKNFYLRTKGRLEYLVQEGSIPKAFIIRPSLLLGPRQEFRLGERIAQLLMRFASPIMLGSLKKYRPVEAQKVATLLVTGLNKLTSDAKVVQETS